MTREEATNLVAELVTAVAWNIAVFHRGGTGKQSGNKQERAITALFTAMTGEKPDEKELDKMGKNYVIGM